MLAGHDGRHGQNGPPRARITADHLRAALAALDAATEEAVEGIDPTETSAKVFDGVVARMAGRHATLRAVTAERDAWRTEALAATARAERAEAEVARLRDSLVLVDVTDLLTRSAPDAPGMLTEVRPPRSGEKLR